MFFSVDVETSDSNIFQAEMLTFGGVPVTEDGTILQDMEFYIRLKHEARDPRTAVINGDATDTETFWAAQDDYAYSECFGTDAYRHYHVDAARNISNWFSTVEPDWSKRFFVANPSSFDKGVVDNFYGRVGIETPYHYRSLCLRSMKFGMTYDVSVYGSDRTNHTPEVPHHALSDAIAQAKDLKDMIRAKKYVDFS